MIRVLLDGNVVTTPDGWEELTSKVKREDQYNAVLIYQESSLEFTGDGYQYLYDKLLTEGFCYVATCEVQESCDDVTFTRLFIGKIFISDVKFNERTCKATAKLEDNSFYALIKNNRKITTALDTNLTKNGQAMTPAVNYDVTFYDVNTGLYQVKIAVPSLRVFEAFKYLISFMSDNRVGFASTLFDIGGTWEGLAITTGQRIRQDAYSVWQPISFEELFTEVYKIKPLVMVLENPYTNPVIRIEEADYAFDAGYSITVSDLYEVVTSCEQDKLYSKVMVGSTNVDDTIAYTFPEDIDYFGFKSESVFIQGECNIDNELDLVGDWVRSSNVIEKQLSNQDNDDAIFFIHTTVVSTTAGETINTNTFDLTPGIYYYNDALRNNKILERWQGGLPNTVVKFIGAKGDGIFEASVITNQSVGIIAPSTINFANEITDVGGYYDGTNKFTALQAGVFYFRMNLTVTATFAGGNTLGKVIPYYYIYDSANNVKQIISPANAIFLDTTTPSKTWTEFNGAILSQGDYVQVKAWFVGATSSSAVINVGSTWECFENSVGGGDFQIYDPNDFPVLIHEFQYPLTNTEWDAILANPIGRIAFNMNGQAYRGGWIQDISYNHITKLASFKLITSKSNAS